MALMRREGLDGWVGFRGYCDREAVLQARDARVSHRVHWVTACSTR